MKFFNKSEGITYFMKPGHENTFHIEIEGLSYYSQRKQKLFINEKLMAETFFDFYKKLRDKYSGFLALRMWFDESDYYDNMTDIYETPFFVAERGNKMAHVFYDTHGAIPKEWTCVVQATFKRSNRTNAVMDFIQNVAPFLSPKDLKKITKELSVGFKNGFKLGGQIKGENE